ncbi:MAG TPA: PEP-CTERM sorting domain-containing protein [Verrucomicrobiae bacterium]|nr:PEP-CTERM sorting domain-containing protein [Verrucomicrobiae bacterium]
MKKVSLFFFSFINAASLAIAADNVSYTATGDPNLAPDGVDQNSSPVDVWTLTFTSGVGGTGYGTYFGTSEDLANAWVEYSYPPDGTAGDGGSDDAITTFTGGALAIGQTVSINFGMGATDPGKEVGVSLLNDSGNAITFYIPGAGPGNYFYSDAGVTGASAGSMGYVYQGNFNIAFTVTGAGTYSAVAGSDSWTGTFSGSLIGMDVFNHGAGNGSDVSFNNLIIATVPEPSTWAMLAAGGMMLLGFRRSFRRA